MGWGGGGEDKEGEAEGVRSSTFTGIHRPYTRLTTT